MWPFKVKVFHDGQTEEEWGPYMKKIEFFNRAIHIFYRKDAYPAPHDHPWDFWTFPLTSYVEEVYDPTTRVTRINVVKSFRWHFRNAEYSHRILGRWSGHDQRHGFTEPQVMEGKVITYVIMLPTRREWGFWHGPIWIQWKSYIEGRIANWMDSGKNS